MTLKDKLTKSLYQNSFDGDSYHTYIKFENMNKIIEEQELIVKEFAKLKCQELLEIVAEKVKYEEDKSILVKRRYSSINKNSILKAVDLNEFIK